MSDKYYTPEIEEFHVGFECEYLNKHLGKKWIPVVISKDNYRYDEIGYEEDYIFCYSGENKFRVRYLDREDIEECGWDDTNNEGMAHNNGYLFTIKDRDFINALIELRFWTNNKRIQIKQINGVIFDGIIKNKSEFKRILKQVDINKIQNEKGQKD